SHVVSGYVGNKSATFPLQVLGFEVDLINSVQFSNHTGYKHVKGQVLNANELEELVEGLKLNGLLNYSHLLTGYIGSISFLQAVKNVVSLVKEHNPNAIYVCDPVMGDNGKMYVPQELLPVYRDQIIPLANIVTPNQFEAEILQKEEPIFINKKIFSIFRILTEKKITSEEDVWDVCEWFHSKGVKSVVLSSTDLGSEEELLGLASSIDDKNEKTRLKIRIPRFPVNFTGSGDLFAALLLGWMHCTNNDVKGIWIFFIQKSVENTVATMQKVLRRTFAFADSCRNSDGSFTRLGVELKLVQSLDDIRNPEIIISASTVQTD
ncbi:Pyridoxal kinase, partial [Armadillidium nasatum]